MTQEEYAVALDATLDCNAPGAFIELITLDQAEARADRPDRDFDCLRHLSSESHRMTAHQVAIIATKDARIAELDNELALLRRAAFDDPAQPAAAPHTGVPGAQPPATPYPVPAADPQQPKEHNPFREFPSDSRRLGQ